MSQIEIPFRTTANIRTDRYEKLEIIATLKGVTVQKLLIFALLKLLKKMSINDIFLNRPIQYQEKSNSWEFIHLTLSPAVYSAIFIVKLCHRISLSLLIAMALDEFGYCCDSREDSYPIYSFSAYFARRDNAPIFAFYWGILEKEIIMSVPYG